MSTSETKDENLLKDAQLKLHEKLQKILNDLDLDLAATQNQLKQVSEQRESDGVLLYDEQARLARLQQNLKDTEANVDTSRNKRIKSEEESSLAEKDRQEFRSNLDALEIEVNEKSKALALDADMVRDLENKKLHVEHELVLSKRTSQKSEILLREQEMKKKQQDFFIDSLHDELNSTKDELEFVMNRLENYKNRNRDSKSLLQESFSEIDNLSIEKKKLFHQWQNCVSFLSKKDLTLMGLRKEQDEISERLRTNQLEIKSLISESNQSKRQLEYVQAHLESLTNSLKKYEENLSNVSDSTSVVKEQITTIEKSSEITIKSLDQVQLKGRLLSSELENVNRQIHVVETDIKDNERKVLEELTMGNKYDKEISSKQAFLHKTETKIKELEETVSNLKNQNLRAEWDLQDQIIKNESIKEEEKLVEAAIQEEMSKIKGIEQEMKSKSGELSVKQRDLDVLVKKYAAIKANIEKEAGDLMGEIGPYEATIHQLEKKIRDKEDELYDLQQQWVQAQSQLVSQSKKLEDVQEQLVACQTKKSLMEKKKILLTFKREEQEEQIKAIQKNCRKIRIDIERLSRLLLKSDEIASNLSVTNKELSINFRTRLAEAERECIKLEAKIIKVDAEKEELTADLFEVEHHILILEKKINFAIEAKELARGTDDEGIDAMEKALQKLKLHYSQLLIDQNKKVQEIQQAVERYGEIAEKLLNSTRQKKSNIKTSISNVQKNSQFIQAQIKECDSLIQDWKSKENADNEELENLTKELLSKDSQIVEITKTMDLKTAVKQKNIIKIHQLQNRTKKIEQMKQNKTFPAKSDRQPELASLETKQQALQGFLLEIQ